MNKINIVSISNSDLIDAKLDQLCGLKQCPGCGHKLEEKAEWVGLPAGVKFDPTDQELIEHLEAKVIEANDMKSHPLIDEFIPTIEGEDGICYTHPEKLPGVTRDGLSRHFFHRPSKAYTTGTRKRRKIQTDDCELQAGGETRWHKTGKTRPVMVSGKQKGCKKIMVLYTNFGKNRKPEKTNWVMHQYHLGQLEEEKEGELVVSKIFYQTQPRQCNWTERKTAINGEVFSRRDRGNSNNNGSCSYKQMIDPLGRDGITGNGFAAALSGYIPMEIQQLQPDHFAFLPFRKSFDEVRMAAEAASSGSIARENPVISGTCDEIEQDHRDDHRSQHHDNYHDHQPQQHHLHHQIAAATAFHLSRPSSHPISTVNISSPPLHHTSIILDEDSYHISRLMLPNEIQQQQQHLHHQRQSHNIGERSASGLEELIMGCNSTDIKGELSMANPQEAEWLKCSNSFWADTENQEHQV